MGTEDWILKGTKLITSQSVVQSLSHVRLFETPWKAARQASLFITNSWSSLRLMSIESVMPSRRLILCHPLLLLPPIPPSIRVFSNESTLRMRWPKYWSFSFIFIFFLSFNFIFKLYNIVLVLPNIEMNLPQVYPRSPSWTLLPPPSPTLPLGRPSVPAPSIQYHASNLDWWL